MSTIDHQVRHRLRVYLAAPLFSEAERMFNVRMTELLEELAEVYLPQRDGGLMSEMVATGVPSPIAARRVFRQDMDAIRQADYVIAILDGRAIDEGVSFELGVAFSQTKRCVGLQTDSRRLSVWGNNPMITGALETVFKSVDELMEWVRASVSVNWAASCTDRQLATACSEGALRRSRF